MTNGEESPELHSSQHSSCVIHEEDGGEIKSQDPLDARAGDNAVANGKDSDSRLESKLEKCAPLSVAHDQKENEQRKQRSASEDGQQRQGGKREGTEKGGEEEDKRKEEEKKAEEDERDADPDYVGQCTTCGIATNQLGGDYICVNCDEHVCYDCTQWWEWPDETHPCDMHTGELCKNCHEETFCQFCEHNFDELHQCANEKCNAAFCEDCAEERICYICACCIKCTNRNASHVDGSCCCRCWTKVRNLLVHICHEKAVVDMILEYSGIATSTMNEKRTD